MKSKKVAFNKKVVIKVKGLKVANLANLRYKVFLDTGGEPVLLESKDRGVTRVQKKRFTYYIYLPVLTRPVVIFFSENFSKGKIYPVSLDFTKTVDEIPLWAEFNRSAVPPEFARFFAAPKSMGVKKKKVSVKKKQNKAELAGKWFKRGLAYIKSGKYDAAIKCFDKAIGLAPSYSLAWVNKGVALFNLGRFDGAIKCFEGALNIDDKLADAPYNLGVALVRLERYEDALEHFDKAINIDPKYVDAWYDKGVALGRLERYKEALVCLREAAVIDPTFTDAWVDRGVVLGKLENYPAAVKCFAEALRQDPNYADAWFNLGVAHRWLGRDDEAKKCFEKAE